MSRRKTYVFRCPQRIVFARYRVTRRRVDLQVEVVVTGPGRPQHATEYVEWLEALRNRYAGDPRPFRQRFVRDVSS